MRALPYGSAALARYVFGGQRLAMLTMVATVLNPRQAVMASLQGLLHAARIDGCSEFRIYWSVTMPVSRPMVGASCLMSFMRSRNNLPWPQILLQGADRFALPIALNEMMGIFQRQYGTLMADAVKG